LSLYISGHNPRRLSFGKDLARIAPNLVYLRFSMSHFSHHTVQDPEGPKHHFCFDKGGLIIESRNCCPGHRYVDAEEQFKREFGEFKYAVKFCLVDVYESDTPEIIWQKWWTNQIIGNGDGEPWNMSTGDTIGQYK